MDSHQTYTVAALFQDRRFWRFRLRRRLCECVNESAERDAPLSLVGAREVGDVQDVGERLLAAAAKREADVRTRRIQ